MTRTPLRVGGYLVPLAWIAVLLALAGELSPVERFAGGTVGLLFSIKVGAWLYLKGEDDGYGLSPVKALLFWTVWPGVRPDLFAEPEEDDQTPRGRAFVEGYLFLVGGVVLGLAALVLAPVVGTDAATWLLVLAFLSCVHFGIATLLPFLLRWAGFRVPDLFDDPLRSRTIAGFWSRRWNRPFVGMNRLLVTRPLSPRIGFAPAAFVAFVVSGVLHELALSYPAGGGWGLPFLYFLVQSALFTVERRVFPEDRDWRPVLRRVWTWTGLLLPLPLLFHAPFRQAFLVPLLEVGRGLLLAHPLSSYLALGLWIGAAGHFLVLLASFQVPEQLEWEEDLASLGSLNRKLMWTYGAFVVLVIVSFGVLTALFHGEFLRGNPVALGLAGMIAVFWTARILVDALYFSHDDWPGGLEFVVGHVLLTSLFALLVAVYGGTIAYHVVGGV